MALAGFPLLGVYRVSMLAQDKISLPRYMGSTWRGLLAHVLKKTVCTNNLRQCEQCLVNSSCVYATLFESFASHATRQCKPLLSAPNPFVLNVVLDHARKISAKQSFQFGFSLFGKANQALPYLVQTLMLAGEHGVGVDSGKFHLISLEQFNFSQGTWSEVYTPGVNRITRQTLEPPQIPSLPDQVDILLTTPLRMKRHGKLIGPHEFSLHHFVQQLFRRTQALWQLYGTQSIKLTSLPVYNSLLNRQWQHKSVRWHDWTRYSSRQQCTMQLGGLLGTIAIDSEVLKEVWPWLWLGQWLHLGKATTMGLGRYELICY